MTILFVVESKKKSILIGKYLGKNYTVVTCEGHFRDLQKENMSIDFDNNFNPIYVITKKHIVANLKSKLKNSSEVILASDLDREGEAIAQHLCDVLKLKSPKRVVFNSCAKKDILNAIKNPLTINKNLVNAQKARRIIDRIYGYTISPILSAELGGKLSAGRVQSVALKIVVDKENEIKNFIDKNSSSSYFRVNGIIGGFKCNLYCTKADKDNKIEYTGKPTNIELSNDTDTDNNDISANVKKFLNNCLKSKFTVHSVSKKQSIRNPAPPFETSTLQQEANRKLGMSISTCMKIAQMLYEGGYITYMRTDSVEISEEGHENIKKAVLDKYGKNYYQYNEYKNKSTTAQEAHEAIRPTDAMLSSLKDELDDVQQIKLYKLIWQRTVASQMKPAKIDVTTIQIDISRYVEKKITPFYYFQTQAEKIVFDGFMKIYVESTDDDSDIKTCNITDIPKVGTVLTMEQISAKQEYMKPPVRYTEASFVAMLKKLEIGRPSTTANIFDTITKRNYVALGNIEGVKKNIVKYQIVSKKGKHVDKITESNDTCVIGKEVKKIIPTELGISVNDYLVTNFSEMLDYKFTAKMEKLLDDVSVGKKVWHQVVDQYYNKILPAVEKNKDKVNKSLDKNKQSSGKLIGEDENGIEVYLLKSKYGYYLRKDTGDEKPVTVKIPNTCAANKIDIKKANELFSNKTSVKISEFKIKIDGKTYNSVVLNGKFGPYVKVVIGKKSRNYSIPKNISADNITEKQITEIVGSLKKSTSGSKTRFKKKPTSGSKTAIKKKPTSGSKTAIKKKPLNGSKTGAKK